MKKLGLQEPSNNDVTNAILKVDKCLKKAKFDEAGTFVTSRNNDEKLSKLSQEPDYWSKLVALVENESHSECTLIAIQAKDSIGLYRSDLYISSHDMNNCNFRKELCGCLVKKKCVIYIDVSSLSSRGKDRFSQLVADLKDLFDKRVTLIIFSINTLPQDVINESHLYFDLTDSSISLNTPVKRTADAESSALKKRLKGLEVEVQNANQKIASLQNELNLKKTENDELKEDLKSNERKFEIKLRESAERIGILKEKEYELEIELKTYRQKNASFQENLHNKNSLTGSDQVAMNTVDKDISAAESLKALIGKTLEQFPGASAFEVIKRTIKEFQFSLMFSDKVLAKDDFKCTVTVVVIDSRFQYYMNSQWVGKGRSKKLSKCDAFNLLLADMQA